MKNVIKDAAQQYANLGLSVIPIKSNKKPAISWTKSQRTIMGQERIDQTFERSWVTAVGIVCGAVSGNLEVIDVDCKYDDTGTLGDDFLSLVHENLSDVYDGLLITKTVNNGYHIYYRCSEKIEGNQKLASRPDNSPLIETRGEGGYVIAPPSPGYELLQGDLSLISTITSDQREILFSIAKSFDQRPIPESPSNNGTASSTSLSPLEDFNERGDVVGILEKHEWVKVKEQGQRIHFRRPGKTDDGGSGNFHTGYRKFYVFSTSTNFEAGKGHSPSNVYAVLECDGDLSKAAKQLYDEGYGERHEYVRTHTGTPPTDDPLPLLPIDGFPPFIQRFVSTCTETYGTPRDYWAGAVLVATALGIGDKLELVDKYNNVPIIWLCNVGDVALGKTEPLKVCLSYFEKKDSEAIRQYNAAIALNERKQRGELIIAPENPEFKQYILKDYTPEALAKVHASNSRGLLIYRDELKGWIDDFGRYNKSGEQSTILSLFNRDAITVNRKGEGPIINIPEPLVLITGGMQPDLLPDFAKDRRAESGFLARFVFTYPDHQKRLGYLEGTLPQALLQTYENYLDRLACLPVAQKLSFDSESKELYIPWYNLNDQLINETTQSYLRGAYGKLPIVCSRLIVVVYGMWLMFSEEESDNQVKAHHVATAIKITEYFKATAEKVYHRIFSTTPEQLPNKKLVAMYLVAEHGLPKTKVAELLRVDRKQIQRWTAR